VPRTKGARNQLPRGPLKTKAQWDFFLSDIVEEQIPMFFSFWWCKNLFQAWCSWFNVGVREQKYYREALGEGKENLRYIRSSRRCAQLLDINFGISRSRNIQFSFIQPLAMFLNAKLDQLLLCAIFDKLPCGSIDPDSLAKAFEKCLPMTRNILSFKGVQTKFKGRRTDRFNGWQMHWPEKGWAILGRACCVSCCCCWAVGESWITWIDKTVNNRVPERKAEAGHSGITWMCWIDDWLNELLLKGAYRPAFSLELESTLTGMVRSLGRIFLSFWPPHYSCNYPWSTMTWIAGDKYG
jgi:hypothetical protein